MSDQKIQYERPQVPESIEHEYYLSAMSRICELLGLEGKYENEVGIGHRIGMNRIRRIVLRPDGYDVEAYPATRTLDPDTSAVLSSTFSVPVVVPAEPSRATGAVDVTPDPGLHAHDIVDVFDGCVECEAKAATRSGRSE